MENQYKAILPLNNITERLFYVNDENQNQRLIVSAMIENPRVWQISKCEDMLMGDFGLLRLTFVQRAFNASADFVDFNAVNPDGSRDVYAMYADYYDSSVIPQEETQEEHDSDICVISSSTNTIKVGGSYKLITSIFYDSSGADITDTYLSELSINNWEFYIDGVEISETGLINVLEQTENNKVKIKFAKDMNYLKKILVIRCVCDDIIGELSLEITNL